MPNAELALLRRRRYTRPPIVDLGPEAAQIKVLVEWRIDRRCVLVLRLSLSVSVLRVAISPRTKSYWARGPIPGSERIGFSSDEEFTVAIIRDVYEGPIFFHWPIAGNPDAAQNRVEDPGRGIFERDLTSDVALGLGPRQKEKGGKRATGKEENSPAATNLAIERAAVAEARLADCARISSWPQWPLRYRGCEFERVLGRESFGYRNSRRFQLVDQELSSTSTNQACRVANSRPLAKVASLNEKRETRFIFRRAGGCLRNASESNVERMFVLGNTMKPSGRALFT